MPLSTDLRMLAWSVVLGLVHVCLASGLAARDRGLKWNAGNRDGPPRPLSEIAARAARANANFLETFLFFTVAVLTLAVANRNTPQSALGAQVYFWARLVYLPIYVAGIPYLRTAVWAVGVWGMLQVVEAHF